MELEKEQVAHKTTAEEYEKKLQGNQHLIVSVWREVQFLINHCGCTVWGTRITCIVTGRQM